MCHAHVRRAKRLTPRWTSHNIVDEGICLSQSTGGQLRTVHLQRAFGVRLHFADCVSYVSLAQQHCSRNA
jgi:hypothetical protein